MTTNQLIIQRLAYMLWLRRGISYPHTMNIRTADAAIIDRFKL